ncbi:MAG: hypothetical protein ACM3O7_04580 [Acidobacteriota bacterium]
MARIGREELERALADVGSWEPEAGAQRHDSPGEPDRIFEWLQANGVDADAFAEFTSSRLPAKSTESMRPRTVYLQGFAVGFRAAQIATERSTLKTGKAAFQRAEAEGSWGRAEELGTDPGAT